MSSERLGFLSHLNAVKSAQPESELTDQQRTGLRRFTGSLDRIVSGVYWHDRGMTRFTRRGDAEVGTKGRRTF